MRCKRCGEQRPTRLPTPRTFTESLNRPPRKLRVVPRSLPRRTRCKTRHSKRELRRMRTLLWRSARSLLHRPRLCRRIETCARLLATAHHHHHQRQSRTGHLCRRRRLEVGTCSPCPHQAPMGTCQLMETWQKQQRKDGRPTWTSSAPMQRRRRCSRPKSRRTSWREKLSSKKKKRRSSGTRLSRTRSQIAAPQQRSWRVRRRIKRRRSET